MPRNVEYQKAAEAYIENEEYLSELELMGDAQELQQLRRKQELLTEKCFRLIRPQLRAVAATA